VVKPNKPNPGLFMFWDFLNCSKLVERFVECLVRKGTCDFMQLVQCRPYQVTVGHRFGWLFVVHSWYFICKITATITGNCVLRIATDGMSFFTTLCRWKKWHSRAGIFLPKIHHFLNTGSYSLKKKTLSRSILIHFYSYIIRLLDSWKPKLSKKRSILLTSEVKLCQTFLIRLFDIIR
jgi:hypothetical protein